MLADPPPADPFSTDWLAMPTGEAGEPDDSLGRGDYTASSNDPLAYLPGVQTGANSGDLSTGMGEEFASQGDSEAADLSWLGDYSAFSTAAGGSGGPSVAASDMDASPFAYSEHSFSGASAAGLTNGTDLSSLFDPASPFPSEALFGGGKVGDFAGDFDTSVLQALFSEAPPMPLPHAHASTAAAPAAGVPLQAVSPASAAAISPQSLAYAQLGPGNPKVAAFPSSPSRPFAMTTEASPGLAAPTVVGSRSGPSHLGVGSLTSSGVAVTSTQRSFSSLAATAGFVVPPVGGADASLPAQVPPATSGPAPSESTQTKGATRAKGSNARTRAPQPKAAPVMRPLAPNPVGLIANAGLRQDVHDPAPFQLLGDVDFSTANRQEGSLSRAASVASSVGRSQRTANAKSDGADAEEDKGKATGRKGRKKAEGGHNAVEQKYRNSINSALAALRDNIPALSHLKPLPSMPTTKRKASQFSLASAAIPETPEGLIDGIPAARTLSKGVILNKAVEYIDFLRYSRNAQNEDLDMLKRMVQELVGDGASLVGEFERRQAERHREREVERKRLLEEDELGEGASGGEDEEEEEEAPAPAPAAKDRPAARGTKRGRPAAGSASTAKKARSSARTAGNGSPHDEPYDGAQQSDASRTGAAGATNAATHPGVHAFPPSPVSSEDRGLSPPANGQQEPKSRGGRAALASFMGASFAGGVGYDLASTAAVAEETLAQAAGRAWTGGLVRRSTPAETTLPSHFSMLHPSLVSGLVALGAACVIASLFYLVRGIGSLRSTPASHPRSRRSRALAALSVISARPTTTYGAARKNALDARRALLRLAGGPSAVVLPLAVAKEALIWVIRRVTSLTWGRDGVVDEQATIEEAMAWIRIAEIEATVGWKIPYLARAHTFLRLSNLSRAPTWPYVSPSTSRPAVDALISMHLLSLGHGGGAEATWRRMVQRRKKSDATGDSFVHVAVAADFEDVKERMAPATRMRKSFDDPASPSDTIPLLYMAEGACEAALEDVWASILIAVTANTAGTSPKDQSAVLAEITATTQTIGRAVVEGSDLSTWLSMTEVFLTIFRHGTAPQTAATTPWLVNARSKLARLALEAKSDGPFSRVFCAQPFFELLAPTLSGSSDAFASLLPTPAAKTPTSKVDLFAATVFFWLICRRSSLAADAAAASSPEPAKPDPALHTRAIAARRLLGHPRFRSTSDEGRENEFDEVDEAFEEARDTLVEALALVARKAAGLKSAVDEDSGVELDW